MTANSLTHLHYSDLSPAAAGSLCAAEWDTYRQSVGQFLADGHAGEFVVLRGTTVVGFWPERRAAVLEAYRMFPDGRFLVHPVAEWQDLPTVRTGVAWTCSPTAEPPRSPLTKTFDSPR